MRTVSSSLEPLESRIAPAAVAIRTGDFDGDGNINDVRLTGGNGREVILIEDSSIATVISIDRNGDGDFTDPRDTNSMSIGFAVGQFEINLRGGNDRLTVELTDDYTSAKSFFIKLGGGRNEFHFLAGDHDLTSGPLRLDLAGGPKNDYLELQFHNVDTTVNFTARLGPGPDAQLTGNKVTGPSTITFDGTYNGPSFAADLNLGRGSNRLAVIFDEALLGEFGAPAEFDLNILGSNFPRDRDDIRVALDNVTLDTGTTLHVTANLGVGNDAFHQEIISALTYSNFSGGNAHGSIIFDVDGGRGRDLLEAIRPGTAGALQLDGLLEYNFSGGIGNDTVSVDLGTTIPTAQLSSSEGATQTLRTLRVNLDGGTGNDRLTLLVANTEDATFAYDLGVYGRTGNDRLIFSGVNNGGDVSYGPTPGAVLDGGLGRNLFSVVSSGGFIVQQLNRDGDL